MAREVGARVERENWQSGTIADVYRFSPQVRPDVMYVVVSLRTPSGEPQLAKLFPVSEEARQAFREIAEKLNQGVRVEWVVAPNRAMVRFEDVLHLEIKDFRIASG